MIYSITTVSVSSGAEILVDIEKLIENTNQTALIASHGAIPNVGPPPDEETIRKKAPPQAEELAR
ncbi:hypothetical protein Ocin01_18158 [Orchesella cincta]|uniref:Uncharacterized protein n=1 Tax=Orchesella cincta TaxID=48709 RepID=A0A1D2M6H6_ORCCI|nr:hypothetical protein Ocin01_18158 [Orchesella cincta]